MHYHLGVRDTSESCMSYVPYNISLTVNALLMSLTTEIHTKKKRGGGGGVRGSGAQRGCKNKGKNHSQSGSRVWRRNVWYARPFQLSRFVIWECCFPSQPGDWYAHVG